MMKSLLLAGAGALMLGVMPASAAPTVGEALKTTATQNSAVDNVHYGRCWRGYDGLRRCRYVRRYRSYGYAPYYDGYYGYGYGPSVGLYFGGGGFGGHRGHWGGHRR